MGDEVPARAIHVHWKEHLCLWLSTAEVEEFTWKHRLVLIWCFKILAVMVWICLAQGVALFGGVALLEWVTVGESFKPPILAACKPVSS